MAFALLSAAKRAGFFRKSSPKQPQISHNSELSPSSSLRDSQRLFILPLDSRFASGSTMAIACSISGEYVTLKGLFSLFSSQARSRVSKSLLRLFFLRAVTPITGTPKRSSSFFKSMLIFLRFASSIRFIHTITFEEISRV